MEEIKQGIAVFPHKSWGVNIRREKSARIVAIGGSNTADGHYVNALEKYLKVHISNSSYVLNEGISGCDGPTFFGRHFPSFERLDSTLWPNIVILEFAINLSGDVNKFYETLIHSLIYKWTSKGIGPPSFLILNVFKLNNLHKYASSLPTAADRIAFINNGNLNLTSTEAMINRGCEKCPEILEFAHTFSIPVWSWVDAAFPACIRYFIGSATNSSISNPPSWHLSNDLAHFSEEGAEFFVSNIAGPFLLEQSRPRRMEHESSSIWSGNYGFELRLTSGIIPIQEMVAFYSSWGPEKKINTLEVVVVEPPSCSNCSMWSFSKVPHRRHLPGKDHICFGSASENSVAEFHIVAIPRKPSEFLCNQSTSGYCSIVISSIHSWDTSYIGNLSCSVFHDSKELYEVFIDGNRNDRGGRIQSTSPVSTVLYANASHEEKYTVKCRKLDNLYTCIDSLILKAEFHL